jgi:hypothetical protein
VLTIRVDAGRDAFSPGEAIRGTLEWAQDEAADAVELRLLWYTEGRGDQDVGMARSLRVASPGAVGSTVFDWEAPSGPWSCSGRLLSIRWALEASAGDETTRVDLVLAPGGCEVELGGSAA